ncbi:hypothetical protein IID22_03205 [Patescibacteria group bacterium]|nr:hypothetical protein [Patescibacteria group bacterium]
MIEYGPDFLDGGWDFKQTLAEDLHKRKVELTQALLDPNHEFPQEDMEGAKRALQSIDREGTDSQAYESNWLGLKLELQAIEEELAGRN